MTAAPTTQPEIAPGAIIRMHFGETPLDNLSVGDGWRLLVVVKAGRVRVTLLNPATLRRVSTTRAVIERARPESVAVRPTRIARRIRAKARTFKKHDIGFPKAAVRDALAALGAA